MLGFFSDQIADRGERLELLVDKTEDLQANVSIIMYYKIFIVQSNLVISLR